MVWVTAGGRAGARVAAPAGWGPPRPPPAVSTAASAASLFPDFLAGISSSVLMARRLRYITPWSALPALRRQHKFSTPLVLESNVCSALSKQRSPGIDRKSTRLNSSHLGIPYAVF